MSSDSPISLNLTQSKLPWVDVKPREPEPKTRPLHKDQNTEMALRFDFENQNPPLEIIRERTVYRPELDFNCLPTGQNWILLTTFGPDPNLYDIPRKQSGFWFWGAFENLEACEKQIKYIKNKNPHIVFLPIHPLELNGRIDFPPPNDGDTSGHILNKEHAQFMERYLMNERNTAEDVENRRTQSLMQTVKAKKAIDRIDQALRDLHNNPLKFTDFESEFEQYLDDDPEVVTPGGVAIDKLIDNLKEVHPSMIQAYIDYIISTDIQLADNYCRKFQIYTRPSDGKKVLVKVITVSSI